MYINIEENVITIYMKQVLFLKIESNRIYAERIKLSCNIDLLGL